MEIPSSSTSAISSFAAGISSLDSRQNVSSHIAAADDYDIAGEPHGIVLINAAQEVDSCDHALSGFAGHAGKSASLKADRDVESLEAAGAELVDRNVPSDIDAALYFDAHAPDSASTTSFSRRKEGMPFMSIPPGRFSRSKTVTGYSSVRR